MKVKIPCNSFFEMDFQMLLKNMCDTLLLLPSRLLNPLLRCSDRYEVLAALLIGKLRLPGSNSNHPD